VAKYQQYYSIEQRVEQFQKYYQRANERPLLGFFVGSEFPLQRYNASNALPDNQPLRPDDFDVSGYLDDCDRLFEIHEACGGDFIWSASPFWGITWLEAALGCPILADHSTGSIYSQPPPDFSGPDNIPAFDLSQPWICKAVEFVQLFARRSAGRWPIGTTRMRGISDLLSALYGSERFVYAMIDDPDNVIKACQKLTDFWIDFGKLQLRHIPEFHGGVGSFYYNMWAPAGTVWLQEDAAALLSPDLYDKFIRKHDYRIAESFPGCIMHQHPTKFLPTDRYLEMPFIALELHVEEQGPYAKDLYEIHSKILERKPLLIWGKLSDSDLDWIFDKLPYRGLAVMTMVDTPDQATGIWQKYMIS
jgi:hypothetical protein